MDWVKGIGELEELEKLKGFQIIQLVDKYRIYYVECEKHCQPCLLIHYPRSFHKHCVIVCVPGTGDAKVIEIP